MKKESLFTCCLLILMLNVFSQTNTFPTSGNAGIGTTAPNYKFEINANNLISKLGGDPSVVGFGTIGANSVNSFVGGIYTAAGFPSSYFSSNIYFTNSGWINPDVTQKAAMIYLQDGNFYFYTASNGGGIGTSKMVVSNVGHVGIGTTTPNANASLDVSGSIFTNGKIAIGTTDMNKIGTYSLAVNGSAIFTKAVVKVNSTWPDYVFEPSFKLPQLDSLEQFIKTNRHLPDVPKADDVKKNGIDLGENQATLLKKIEELTLIVIEQNKEIEEQNKRIEKLETKNMFSKRQP